MPKTSPNQPESSPDIDRACRVASCDGGAAILDDLLGQLETEAEGPTEMCCVVDPSMDQRMARQRLGSATGLFVALRSKDAAAAAHGYQGWFRNLAYPVKQQGHPSMMAM